MSSIILDIVPGFSTGHKSAVDKGRELGQDGRTMKRILIAVVLLGGMALAGEATSGKLLDVQSHMVANNSVLGRWARSDGGSAVIPDARRVISITVLIEDMQYTANFMAGKHLTTGALVIGDPLAVRLDKDKMFIKGDDGKEVRGYVVRRERVTSSPAQ